MPHLLLVWVFLIEDLVCNQGFGIAGNGNGGPGVGPLQSGSKHTIGFTHVDVVNYPNKNQLKGEKVYFVYSSGMDTIIMVGKAQ